MQTNRFGFFRERFSLLHCSIFLYRTTHYFLHHMIYWLHRHKPHLSCCLWRPASIVNWPWLCCMRLISTYEIQIKVNKANVLAYLYIALCLPTKNYIFELEKKLFLFTSLIFIMIDGRIYFGYSLEFILVLPLELS